METIPAPLDGFVRIQIRLHHGLKPTPGELVQGSHVALEDLGPIHVEDSVAFVDVRTVHGRSAREKLEKFGGTKLVGWQWQWVKLHIGRNHGLNIGQFRKVMQQVDALPMGRIMIQNTHTLVGLQDFKIPAIMARMSTLRVNGYAARAEVLPLGQGPGSAEYRAGER
jgi:hypothetical protein